MSTVRKTLQTTIIVLVAASIVVASFMIYSYGQLLDMERRFMPDFASLATKHERQVRFKLSGRLNWSSTWLPIWTVDYFESPVTDIYSTTPSLTVDILGRLADASGKEVRMAAGIY